MENQHGDLMSMSDIASLAQVRRPVVNMWIKRHAAGSTPFPEPAVVRGEQRYFFSHDVVSWLEETGKGNNPHVRTDAGINIQIDPQDIEPLTALLALRTLVGEPLGTYAVDDLVDLADEEDPDDEFLFKEIHESRNLQHLAKKADMCADAAYTAAHALEAIYSARNTDDLKERSQTALSEDALSFLADVALALRGQGAIVEATRGGSDLLLSTLARLPETESLTVGLQQSDTAARSALARMAMRRVVAVAVGKDNVILDSVHTDGQATYLAQLPSPEAPDAPASALLSQIDELALSLDRQDRALIVGPASILSEPLEDKELDSIRSTILRSRRVHVIASLPSGVRAARPRQRMALWILGPELPSTGESPARMLVSDLSLRTLTQLLNADFGAQLAFGLRNMTSKRPVAVIHSRWMPLPTVVAASTGLIPAPRMEREIYTDYATSARAVAELEALAEVVQETNEARPEFPFEFSALETRLDFKRGHEPTIGELLESGALKHLPGTRFAPGDVDDSVRSGIGIWEAHLLPSAKTDAAISHFALANGYGNSQLTEPGDIVFSTTGEVRAVVDRAGSRVVRFPAKALRITADNSSGLIPDLIVEALNRQQLKQWPRTHIRICPEDKKDLLVRALEFLKNEQKIAQKRIETINALENSLTNMVIDQKIDMIDRRTQRKEGSNATP
ncbi:hypothetical protein ACT3UD_02045 [Glutamicibacter sp. 287]|uniref:hypothetical protein n=1 Tax=unclassified Glutamicibacter TaxID=2627139 RepID=UPI000BB7BD56|nr:hypothetical protein [Glutamicibacter sp. BW80]PCC28012.1 hypothetical protein CIK76_14200 [Glutamicibacter sp. BW80]